MMLTNNYSLYTDNNSGTRVYSEYIKMNAMFTDTKYISCNKSIDENEYQRGECNILNSCILFTTVITLDRNKLLSNSEERIELLILKNMLCLFMFCCSVKVELKICTTSHLKSGIKLNRAHRVTTRTLKDGAEPALHRSVSQQPTAQSVTDLSSFAFLQFSFSDSHHPLLEQPRAIVSFPSASLA